MITLEELKIYLAENVDEVELLELLQLNSNMLIGGFDDVIENNFDYICHKFGLDEDEVSDSEK